MQESKKLLSKTVTRETSLIIDPINDNVEGVKVRINGVTIAMFDLCTVWDFLKDALIELDMKDRNPLLGLGRRKYEAENINRLTGEWCKLIDEKREVQNAKLRN